MSIREDIQWILIGLLFIGLFFNSKGDIESQKEVSTQKDMIEYRVLPLLKINKDGLSVLYHYHTKEKFKK